MEEFEKKPDRENAAPKEPEILVTASKPAAAPRPRTGTPNVQKTGAPSARPMRAARRVPAAKPAAPVAKPAAPVAKPATPVAKPVTPAAKPVTPVAKPVTPAAKPVTPAAKPAAPVAKPVASVKKPTAPLKVQRKPRTVKEKPSKEKKAERREQSAPAAKDHGGVIISLTKALIYIAFVLVVSGFLAVFGIRVVNDVFAFVKDDVTVEVTVGEGATLEDVSELLYSEGLIENADWFRIYTNFKYRDRDIEIVPGTYTLNSTMNYNTLIASLMPRGGREIVSILIPEGYTVDQIIDLLVEKGIGTREGYVDAIQNYDYNYEFLDVLDSIEKKDGRKYRLEGYLFPAKYDVYKDSGEIAVIDKMLSAFQDNFGSVYNDRLTELGMNMDEIITLASIIQREAHYSSDMYYISGVFHNRLNNAANYPFLGSDATVQYALPEHKEELTAEDLEVDSPYNTHKYKGLTPGAICNPGMDAITAALYPEDKLLESRGVKSYYFVAGVDGYSIFGANEAEHLNNIAKVASDKEAAKEE